MTDRIQDDSPPELGELLVEWNRRLYEDGFEDVETAGPDGPMWDQVTSGRVFSASAPRIFSGGSEAEVVLSESDTLEGYAAEGAALLATLLTLQHEAREALYEPDVWRGLPSRARRWWALQALAGLSYSRATALAGVHRRQARRWRRVILERIEGGRRGEGDDE